MRSQHSESFIARVDRRNKDSKKLEIRLKDGSTVEQRREPASTQPPQVTQPKRELPKEIIPSASSKLEQIKPPLQFELPSDKPKREFIINSSASAPAPAPSKPQGPTIILRKDMKRPQLVIEYPQFKWGLSQAISFRIPDTLKLDSDEQCIALHSNLLRFHVASRKNKRITPQISLSDSEKQRHLIRQELNKLSPKNFLQIIDSLTNNESFATQDGQFLTMLAVELYDAAKLQPLFSDMYSLFVEQICQVLDNTEFRTISDKFINCLREKVFSLFEPNHDFSGQLDIHLTHASFLGCLAARPRLVQFDLPSVFEGAIGLLSHPVNPIKLEVCGKLVIPCGHLLDKDFGERAQKEIFGPFETFSRDKKLPGNVRYFLMDILQARGRHWDITSLLNQINIPDRKPTPPPRPRSPQRAAPKQESPRITVGYNPFAGLNDYSDESFEEEFIDEEFDAVTMIREFIFDKTLSHTWDKHHSVDLMLAIAEYPSHDVPRASAIFRALYESDLFDLETAKVSIQDVVTQCQSDAVRDTFPDSLANCGIIFGHLVGINAVTVDDWPNVFHGHYNFEVVANFLDQMVELRKLPNLRESDFWMNYGWRPDENVLHLEIMERLLKKWPDGELLELFPIYDNLSGIQLMLNDELPLEEFVNNLKEIPDDVSQSTGFALGIVELIMKEPDFQPKRDYWIRLLQLPQSKQTEMLTWIEFYGTQQNWQAEQIKWWINRLSEVGGLDQSGYKRSSLGPQHDRIVALLDSPE